MIIMGEKEINIAISTDENYAKYCIVTIVSVKETQKDFDKINVFVLSKNLSPKTQKLFQDLNTENFKVKLIDISTIDVSSIKIDIPRKRTLPDLTYCRVFIADILKDIEKILYLDCDVIVKDNLLPLWQTDLTNYYFAAVEDHCSESILKKHNCRKSTTCLFFSGRHPREFPSKIGGFMTLSLHFIDLCETPKPNQTLF